MKTKHLIALLVAIIGAAATIVAARAHDQTSTAQQAPAQEQFSGIVRNSVTKEFVAGVQITAAADQGTPQVVYSDSHGIFQVQLPAKTTSLSIDLSASGYQPFSVEANPRRTGPEQILLKPNVGTRQSHAAASVGALQPPSVQNTFTTKGKNSPIITGSGSPIYIGDRPTESQGDKEEKR